MNDSLELIRDKLKKADTILLAAHTNPDGDAIGSSMGLALSLTRLGKKVTVLLEDYGAMYEWIPGKQFLIHSADALSILPDLFVALDCGDKERLGTAAKFCDSVFTINLDHHISNTRFGNLNYVEEDISSTSELVYRLLDGCFPIDKESAASLYTGILFDTGGFRHSCTSPVTMTIAGELLSYGIDSTKIYDACFRCRSYSETRLMGRALERAALGLQGKVVYSYLTREDIQKLSGSVQELGGIVSELKAVKNTETAVFLYEKAVGEVKVSFRSETADVCRLAKGFGGGGHVKASGCTIFGTVQEALRQVLEAVEREI